MHNYSPTELPNIDRSIDYRQLQVSVYWVLMVRVVLVGIIIGLPFAVASAALFFSFSEGATQITINVLSITIPILLVPLVFFARVDFITSDNKDEHDVAYGVFLALLFLTIANFTIQTAVENIQLQGLVLLAFIALLLTYILLTACHPQITAISMTLPGVLPDPTVYGRDFLSITDCCRRVCQISDRVPTPLLAVQVSCIPLVIGYTATLLTPFFLQSNKLFSSDFIVACGILLYSSFSVNTLVNRFSLPKFSPSFHKTLRLFVEISTGFIAPVFLLSAVNLTPVFWIEIILLHLPVYIVLTSLCCFLIARYPHQRWSRQVQESVSLANITLSSDEKKYWKMIAWFTLFLSQSDREVFIDTYGFALEDNYGNEHRFFKALSILSLPFGFLLQIITAPANKIFGKSVQITLAEELVILPNAPLFEVDELTKQDAYSEAVAPILNTLAKSSLRLLIIVICCAILVWIAVMGYEKYAHQHPIAKELRAKEMDAQFIKAGRMTSIRFIEMNDKQLLEMQTLSQANTLSFAGTEVTKEGVTKLKETLPDCEIRWESDWFFLF